ncbi:hypothetical protein EV182_007038, partial [Spiromyces aspiralis]
MQKYDPSHDWYHVQRVVRQALRIAADESRRLNRPDAVDLEVVHLASLLHDVNDAKYKPASGETSITDFLIERGLDGVRAELIARIVQSVSFRQELQFIEQDSLGQADPDEKEWRATCLELHCVQDADRLESIGAFGIARCMAFSAARNRPLFDPEDKPIDNMSFDQYEVLTKNNEGSAVRHFYEKLFRIKDLIKTHTGREEAERRT